jgi:hypothetical protein
MNIHIMRFVSVIALTMITAVALAKNPHSDKLKGNNSRIQALEAEVDDLRTDLNNIELTPGPQGEPGNDAPDRTVALCALYEELLSGNQLGDLTLPDFCAPAQPAFKTVFVTSTVHSAALGGIDGADAICQDLATSVQLSGTFKAWLSDSASSAPAGWSTDPSIPYVLVTGVTVADNWADLTDGTLDVAIGTDERGVDHAPNSRDLVWTNVRVDGTTGSDLYDCDDWMTVAPGSFGDTGSLLDDHAWTQAIYASCGDMNRLYCFEQ